MENGTICPENDIEVSFCLRYTMNLVHKTNIQLQLLKKHLMEIVLFPTKSIHHATYAVDAYQLIHMKHYWKC